MPWVADGIDDTEAAALREFLYIAPKSTTAISHILAMEWIQNGVDEIEAQAIDWLVLGEPPSDLLLTTIDNWGKDSISTLDAEAIRYLALISRDHGDSMLPMPFLSTVEASDVAALESLYATASRSEEEFRDVMAHPTLSVGITDYWAKVLTTLSSVVETGDPDLLEHLLSPSNVSVEERQIHLPFTGATSLALIRVDVEGSAESVDRLVEVLVELDAVMATSLPTSYIGVLVADGGWFGHNAGSHVAIAPEYDENPGLNFGLRHLFMHEIGHYFWRGNKPWINEGIANTLADLFELKVTGRNTYQERDFDGCDKVTIEDLDNGLSGFPLCPYHLGTPLFMELHGELGESRFHEGLRKLYQRALGDAEVGVREVKTAFVGVAEDADEVEAIIDRWYFGDSS